MQEKARSNWVRCPFCRHKLFKLVDGWAVIEVKCHSCKQVFECEIDACENEQDMLRLSEEQGHDRS